MEPAEHYRPTNRTQRRRRGPTSLTRERAFQMLFREQTIKSVRVWLERLGVPLRDREDLLQDVLLGAFESFHRYDPDYARPERWLNGIAVHVASHHRESGAYQRERLCGRISPKILDTRPEPDELFRVEELRGRVRELLMQVPPVLRLVLVAHDLEGISMIEIAERCRLPLSTTYKHRIRALVAFRRVVEDAIARARDGEL